MKHKKINPICPYCGEESILTDGREIYPNRPDLFILKFWICRDCKAHVGCHKGKNKKGNIPLGTLAKQGLRTLRSHAHRHFDPIWKEGPMTRRTAYIGLAGSLEIDVEVCHISQMNESQCQKVIQICKGIKVK